MARRLILTLTVLGLLAGCARIAESRFNPLNWFGRGSEVETLAPLGPEAPDSRPLIEQVTELVIERVPGGAIVRARGLPATQGYWDGELVADNGGDPVEGILTYRFRVIPPVGQRPVSTPRSREVIVGQFLSDQSLEGVREIRVVSAGNTRSARR